MPIYRIYSVVALHGLDGHAYDQWEYRNGKDERFMWLRDGLPEKVPGARIMTYGYDADPNSAFQNNRVRTHAETFALELTSFRKDSEVSAPFIS